MLRLQVNREFLIVILSISIQVPLAIFLGHYYDQRSFLDTGYLVGSGLNPYQPYNITVFLNPDMIGINPIIGYPPLWPLLLGAIYRLTYNLTPNLFLYTFAIKIPVIISNIALAYVTKLVMKKLNAPPKQVRFAWLFLLFNPFTLLTTTAWGEFDTLIALLCVSSLYLLCKDKIVESSLLLSLSIALKPISLPLIGLPLLFSTSNNRRKNVIYLLILVLTVALLWFFPFHVFQWTLPSSPDLATSYFKMADSMTLFNLVELIQNTALLPMGLEFLGYLWIPALLVGYLVVYRYPPKTLAGLMESAVGLLLIFFLTRTWLSEPNINLIISLALIALASKKLSFRSFHFLWVIPFIFLFLNTALPQLFFLVSPSIIPALAQLDQSIRFWRLLAKFAVVIVWAVFGWNLTVKLLRHKNSGD
jgi:Gpi18-like mannosyltransferase